ncbi:MAG: hypothetical protein LQ340_004397, partial [Diploschistes diacapsis]
MDTGFLSTQVNNAIAQLHGLFDEIGVTNHERESRETELFTALSEALNNQLRLVTAEKNQMTEEAYRIIKSIRQMEASLEDNKAYGDFALGDEHLKVSAPLTRCLKGLKEKHNSVAKVHRDRFEQVKKLVIALESYSSHLELSFIKIKLPPTAQNAQIPPNFDLSPSYIASLDNEFTRVYEEYSRRVESVKVISGEIVNLWAELGIPQAQTDDSIVKHYKSAPEQLGLHESDISRLSSRRDKLLDEKTQRERRLKELKTTVEGLWDRLGVEDMDRKRFLAGTRGFGLRVINEFEAELDRLNELKRQNLHLFVEDARYKLQELWDILYFSEEEMLEFTPAFSDVYSDALLSAHENEIARLVALKEQRLPTLQMVEKHRTLTQERDDLAASSQDASRLMLKPQKGEKRDPGKLLREEKMRKRIAKDLPKVEAELRKVLEQWEDEYGRPFLVHGEPYLEELEAAAAKAPPPPRSKTPSVPMSAQKTLKSTTTTTTAPPSRQGSVMRAPPRAATKTPVSTIRRNPMASSVNSTVSKPVSPSKIPARVPLGTMKTGNNSPERKPAASSSHASAYDVSTIRKMGPPRAPPPRMRDLFAPPQETPREAPEPENWRSASVASNHSGPIRQISPEDVYDDREHMSYAPPSYPSSTNNNNNNSNSNGNNNSTTLRAGAPPQLASYHNPHAPVAALPMYDARYRPHQYVPHSHPTSSSASVSASVSVSDQSRITSTASSTSQAVSGSENWETYDDASEPEEPEPDASSAYYAKLRAVQQVQQVQRGQGVHG